MPRQAAGIYQPVSTINPEESSSGIQIPSRVQEAKSSISSTGSAFVERARQYVNRVEVQADPVPFQQYWPTYASMSEEQQRWYFYWRTQLRQDNWLTTDLSYLFVHVYEVINMIGFDNPKDAFNHLVQFWQYYRESQPKLDRYLPDWIADFIVFHRLAPNALNWYKALAGITEPKDQDYVIDAWVKSGGDFAALPINDVFNLANYNPRESSFYRCYARVGKLDRAFSTSLAAVDAAIREESGKSLILFYQSKQLHNLQRAPFDSAVHAYPRSRINIFLIPSWTTNRRLSRMLRNLLKYTEATVCQQSGHKYEQQNIRLKARWKAVVESALEPEAPKRKASIERAKRSKSATKSRKTSRRVKSKVPQRKTAIESALKPEEFKRELSIDMSQVEQLSLASEALRARLLAEDDTGLEQQKPQKSPSEQQEPLTMPADVSASVDGESMVKTSANGADTAAERIVSDYLKSPENISQAPSTDLAEVAQFVINSGSRASNMIAELMNSDWECPVDAIQSAFPGEFISVIIDEINSNALETVGDNLILEEDGRLIVPDEYRVEIEYTLQHPEYRKA